jgi:hypothetical protein
MTPVVRAQQLIALACSTQHEEEARTAAVAAARIIGREELRILPKVEARPTRSPPTRSPFEDIRPDPSYRPTGDWWESAWRDAPPSPPQPQRQRSDPPPAKAPRQGVWKVCRGATLRCYDCGNHIEDGERYYEWQTSWAGRQIWCGEH